MWHRSTVLSTLKSTLCKIFSSTVAAGVVASSVQAASVPALDGRPFTATIEALQGGSAALANFDAATVVAGPGLEFSGAVFTPNSAGAPPEIQRINSIGLSVDLFSATIEVTFERIVGSISGFHNFFLPSIRVIVASADSAPIGLEPFEIILASGFEENVWDFGFLNPQSIFLDFNGAASLTTSLPDSYRFVIPTQAVSEPHTLLLFTLALGFVVYESARRSKSACQRSNVQFST
jgi:hypothetical protein